LRPRLATGLPFSLTHERACMLTSLPMGDEFAMNFEGVGLCFVDFLFFSTFLQAGSELRIERDFPGSRDLSRNGSRGVRAEVPDDPDPNG
jgi:hypothetical protein